MKDDKSNTRALARECGEAADWIVRRGRMSQMDRDGVVLLLRRAEKALLDHVVEMRARSSVGGDQGRTGDGRG